MTNDDVRQVVEVTQETIAATLTRRFAIGTPGEGLVLSCHEAHMLISHLAAQPSEVERPFPGECTYCGWFGVFESSEARVQGFREHLEQCRQHPMAVMRGRAEKAEADVKRLESDLAVTQGQPPINVLDELHGILCNHGIVSRLPRHGDLVTQLVQWAAQACRQSKASPPAPSGWQQRIAAMLEQLQFLKPVGHDGDEESGQHYDDCQACAYNALKASIESLVEGQNAKDAIPPSSSATSGDVPVEEIESAAGLCESEARRWETAAPKTAEHWNRVATILRSHALVAFVRKDALPPVAEVSPAKPESRWFGELRRLWEEIVPPRPACRDCADASVFGTCDHDGLPCDPTERALSIVRRMKAASPVTALLERLRIEVASVGSQDVAASRLGISPQYLCDVLKGRREPGKRLLDALGYRRVVVYQQIAEADASPVKDPITAAVDAQLDPLKDELIKAGHKLAKETE